MLKRAVSGVTALMMTCTLLMCGSTVAFAQTRQNYSEDFSNEVFVSGERIAGVENGALVTVPHINGGTWKWTSTNTNVNATTNTDVFTTETDGTNQVAKYNHPIRRVSGTTETNNERYGVVFDEAYEGDVTISFKLKGTSGAFYMFVGDDGTTNSEAYPLTTAAGANTTWGIPIFKMIQGSSTVTSAYYPNAAFRTDTPASDKGDASGTYSLTDSAWNEYAININTYTGETALTFGNTTNKLPACTSGVGTKVGSFYFYIERNSAVSYMYIDDISVSVNNISTLTFEEVTGNTDNTIASGSLPTSFNGLGENWSIKWSGNLVAEDGTVTQGTSDVTDQSMTASFYRTVANDDNTTSEVLVGSKMFTEITIAAVTIDSLLNFDTIKKANTEQGGIESELTLTDSLADGEYTVAWKSSHPDVISTDGKVVRTAFDQPVTLTAAISKDGSEPVIKKFHLNVAAERTDLYFEERMTEALPEKFATYSSTTEDTWTVLSSTALNQEIPSAVSDPFGDEDNQVLELRKIATRNSNVSALNGNTGLYRKIAETTGGDVQYVSVDFYATESTPRTELRIFDTNGIRVAGISYINKSGVQYLSAFNGSNLVDFFDQNGNNKKVSLNVWHNITIKLDYIQNKATTYLDGNYAGWYTLYDSNASTATECQTLGYIYLGMERNEKNPVTGEVFSEEAPGLVYFDNITVRTAADEANGIYEVLSYNNGNLKMRKIVNTDKESSLIAAGYTEAGLSKAKIMKLGTGNDCPSIITLTDFEVTGDNIKIFNWEMDTLTPVCNGILYSK